MNEFTNFTRPASPPECRAFFIQHRILMDVLNLAIWECMAAGKLLNELFNAVTNEFYAWVKQTKADLETNFARIEAECSASSVDHSDWRGVKVMYRKI